MKKTVNAYGKRLLWISITVFGFSLVALSVGPVNYATVAPWFQIHWRMGELFPEGLNLEEWPITCALSTATILAIAARRKFASIVVSAWFVLNILQTVALLRWDGYS